MLKLFDKKNYIDGRWISFPDHISVDNPSNNQVIGHVPNLSAKQIPNAIDATVKGFRIWSQSSIDKRYEVLRK